MTIRKLWNFKAENIVEATACVQNWIKTGIMPGSTSYTITENPDRPGYFIAEQH